MRGRAWRARCGRAAVMVTRTRSGRRLARWPGVVSAAAAWCGAAVMPRSQPAGTGRAGADLACARRRSLPEQVAEAGEGEEHDACDQRGHGDRSGDDKAAPGMQQTAEA